MPKDKGKKLDDANLDKFLWVEPEEWEAIEEFLYATGSHYGTFHTALLPADIEALKSGKWLIIGQGEYATIISYMGREE